MTISLIMPVYNEELLLQHHLPLAAEAMDEIVIVDGSPNGVSTDNSQAIAKEHGCKVVEGTFAMPAGGWDRQAQVEVGVESASGDYLLIQPCDYVYNDYGLLRRTVEGYPAGKVFYGYMMEFFRDCNNIRMCTKNVYPLLDIAYPVVHRSVLQVDRYAHFFRPDALTEVEVVFTPDVVKYHYGWVRSFPQQVARHVRNVRAGYWGEEGRAILDQGEMRLYFWAIGHVLSYEKIPTYPYAGNGHPLSELSLSYTNDMNVSLTNFETEFNRNFYEIL